MRLDGTVTLRVDGRPARLTAAGTALRLEFPDPPTARLVVRGHQRAGGAVARALTAAGVTLRVYGGPQLLLVLGREARPGLWRLLTRSRDVGPAGVRGLLPFLLPRGPRPRTGQTLLEPPAAGSGRRRHLEVPLLRPWISSLGARLVTRAHAHWAVTRALVLGLIGDLLARGDRNRSVVGRTRRIAPSLAAVASATAGNARPSGVPRGAVSGPSTARGAPPESAQNRP